jgi:hypothetical protein
MPAWEDAANKEGGKWAVQLPRDKTKGAIDQMWLYTVCPSLINRVRMKLTIRCSRPLERRL